MRRRAFITVLSGAAALVFGGSALMAGQAVAQDRVWRLGVLTTGSYSDNTLTTVTIPELARRGFVEGCNLIVLPRSNAGSDPKRLAELASDLAASRPDVIVASSLPAAQAAKAAAPQTPIAASFVDDPVRDGLATTLSRPGGKVTGIATLSHDGNIKRLQLLHEAIPTAHRLGYLASPYGNANEGKDLTQAAGAFGIEIVFLQATGEADYQTAFEAMRRAPVDGVVIASSPVFARDTARIVALAAERRLATICEWQVCGRDSRFHNLAAPQ